MPRDEEEREIMEQFFNRKGFPEVIASVDGTHIRIKSPGENLKSLYYNRKGYCSINAMIICDHKMTIKFVDARHPGSIHDAFIWEHSVVDQVLQENFHGGKGNAWISGQSIHMTKVRPNVTARDITTNHHVAEINQESTRDVLPIPKNIDVTETTKFSPLRSREISATFILMQYYQPKLSPKTDIIMENCVMNGSQKLVDPHVQSYDCFGTICLNSTMQSNVPTPFGGMHKFTHLNMPGGQWSQHYKFMSENLQSSHYANIRKQTRFNWSPYNKEGVASSTDSANAWTLQIKRSYCNKFEEENQPQSKKNQLKKAFKLYGSTIVIFHVAISLVSLGGFYLLISSGVDLIALLESLGFPSTVLKDNVARGATNFVISYTIHKLFAPVRISITLAAAPFIVKYLRSKGLIKSSI